MITKINLNKIASYKNLTVLETDKKVNLIYGLNGTGKSTLSNFLYKPTDERYKNCSVEGLDSNHEILIYNQTFIQEIFFESESLRGIFTLAKVNKEAEIKITNAQKEILKLENEKELKSKDLVKENSSLMQRTESIKNSIWKIKTDYSGGDRVLEFCLDGYKGSKDSLFNYIVGLQKTTAKPTKGIADLKIDLQSISGENAQKYSELSQIVFALQNIEVDTLFSKVIIGNENSTVSQLIKELQNPDWVKDGMQYLPNEPFQENATCPFCQEKTISHTLIENIKNYFDEKYETDINSLKLFLTDYTHAIQLIPNKSIFETNPKFELYKKDFEIKYSAFLKIVEDNKKYIEDKIKTPSVSLTLKSSTAALLELNEIIQKINNLIIEHNNNIDRKDTVKASIKKSFWENMRWEYDPNIVSFNTDKATVKGQIETLDKEIKDCVIKIANQFTIIAEQQKQTVNIEDAIKNINNGLEDLGIDDFKILLMH